MQCLQPLHGDDTCWPVRTPLLYTLKNYGKLPNASDPLVMMNETRQRGWVLNHVNLWVFHFYAIAMAAGTLAIRA